MINQRQQQPWQQPAVGNRACRRSSSGERSSSSSSARRPPIPNRAALAATAAALPHCRTVVRPALLLTLATTAQAAAPLTHDAGTAEAAPWVRRPPPGTCGARRWAAGSAGTPAGRTRAARRAPALRATRHTRKQHGLGLSGSLLKSRGGGGAGGGVWSLLAGAPRPRMWRALSMRSSRSAGVSLSSAVEGRSSSAAALRCTLW